MPLLTTALVFGQDFGPYSYSSLVMILLTVFLAQALISSSSKGRNGSENRPPGPSSSWFVVKFLLEVIKEPTTYLRKSVELGEKYGKIVAIDLLGLKLVVIISDLKILKEAFNNPAVSGRRSMGCLDLVSDGRRRGLIFNAGKNWTDLRRFTSRQLNSSLTLTKSDLDAIVSREAAEVVKLLTSAAEKNAPLSTKHLFHIPIFNVVWKILSSERLETSDQRAMKMIEQLTKVSTNPSADIYAAMAPYNWTKWVPFLMKNMENLHKEFMGFFPAFVKRRVQKQQEISQGEEDYKDNNSHVGPMDYTQAFLDKIRETSDPNSVFYGKFGEENLTASLRDLFIGSSETSSVTLSWMFLYLSINPEKQRKLQREIDQVLQGQPPSLDDRSRLLYVEAVIHETLRRCSVLPHGLYHEAIEDTTISGYTVPKGSIVISNIYAIHHCEETWPNPYEFRPERWLSQDESTFVKQEAFLPFSIGRRICPGERIGRDSLFLFVANIFGRFTVSLNPNEPTPNLEPEASSISVPPAHTVFIQQRTRFEDANH